ncbi:MAG: pentapeptide repeat-containing protein, partial [Phycisphaerales bacterium]
SNANLTGVNIYQANLYGADLSGAILDGVDLSVAVFIPPVTGSCCVSSGCTTNSEAECTELGGTWTEGGFCDECSSAPSSCAADLSGDGIVGFDDLVNVISNWGVCP